MIRSTSARTAALLLAPTSESRRPAGPVIDAFASIGWEWGGDWNKSKDNQHFSQNGR